ncbi:MAG: response regulator transcription factor [Chloroflexi bacterium OHK40]
MALTALVVDDDPKTVELITLYMEREGFTVVSAYDGRRALDLARQRHPDLIVLDLMLPHVDGLDITRIIRSESRVPVIMLTARTTEHDMLLGLDLGADDYVTKPFSPRELMARVRAVMRRARAAYESAPAIVRYRELVISFASREVRRHGELVRLTPKEYGLLELMARSPGRAFARAELLRHVFGADYEGLDRTVDVHVMNLRRKIEPDPANPCYVLTVYGYGYKFGAESESPAGGTAL